MYYQGDALVNCTYSLESYKTVISVVTVVVKFPPRVCNANDDGNQRHDRVALSHPDLHPYPLYRQ